jgi:hypothetical protein
VGDGSPNEFGCDPSDYQPQKCPILVNGEPVVPYPFQDTKVRPATYYHHSDHLGSTSWVTDQNGKVHKARVANTPDYSDSIFTLKSYPVFWDTAKKLWNED